MVHLISAAALALSGLTLTPAKFLVSAEPISAPQPLPPPTSNSAPSFAASPDHARENAVHIFNALHSAMRQWGSSLHHNGLALIPATVPQGTLLYHGTRLNSTPEGFEWLAFEMEHSEGFARSWRGGRGTPSPKPPPPGNGPGKGPPGGKPPPGNGPPGGRPPGGSPPLVPMVDEGGQRRLGSGEESAPPGPGGPNDDTSVRGHFHTYRANRDLKLLYLDGMAAGKTGMGTLDTQDFLLRGLQSAPGFGEYDRAREVCELVKKWGLDGVIRMEIGFEIIYCDFFDGLDPVSVLRRPWNDQWEGMPGIDMFEWSRAVSQRYDGIGGGRVRLDFGAMVSGLWYPLNVSNPNGRKDMPRLGTVTEGEREVILGRVEELVRKETWNGSRIDWQGVADMVVTRHGDRIETLADEVAGGGDEGFASQLLVVTNTFVDYPRDASDSALGARADNEEGFVRDARERCAANYLTPAAALRDEWTAEDGLIYEAVEAVVRRICGDLYDARALLVDAAPRLAGAFSEAEIRDVVGGSGGGNLPGAVKEAREIVRTLKEDLGWSTWKRCRPGCDVGELCFVAMWPFGLKQDHYNPSCLNRTELQSRGGREAGEGYWEWEPRR
ncbi:hypothetical protein EsH8_VI_001038 [Colletotrichum jinshuiense]